MTRQYRIGDCRVASVDNDGTDEGRWIVSLKPGYGLGTGYDRQSSFSCGSPQEANRKLAQVTPDGGA